MSEVDEIISLVRQGVDFGSMATIRTLIDEIHSLRSENNRLKDGLEVSRQFARRSYTQVVSIEMVYIPFHDWDLFRDAIQATYKQPAAPAGDR